MSFSDTIEKVSWTASDVSVGALLDGDFLIVDRDFTHPEDETFRIKLAGRPLLDYSLVRLSVPDISERIDEEDQRAIEEWIVKGFNLLSRLHHPCIPSIVAGFQNDRDFFIIKEFESGKSIYEIS